MMTETNNKEVYIRFKSGEKETEIKMSGIEEQQKLALIDGLFKFFNVNVDFKEMAQTYNSIGRAYKDFYESVDNTELTETNEQIQEEDGSRIDSQTSEEDWNWSNQESNETSDTDYFKTGIKMKGDVPHYRCRYICPKCRTAANHYIKRHDRFVNCHECNFRMRVNFATNKGFPHCDSHQNFFVAGKFEKEIISKENDENGDS